MTNNASTRRRPTATLLAIRAVHHSSPLFAYSSYASHRVDNARRDRQVNETTTTTTTSVTTTLPMLRVVRGATRTRGTAVGERGAPRRTIPVARFYLPYSRRPTLDDDSESSHGISRKTVYLRANATHALARTHARTPAGIAHQERSVGKRTASLVSPVAEMNQRGEARGTDSTDEITFFFPPPAPGQQRFQSKDA